MKSKPLFNLTTLLFSVLLTHHSFALDENVRLAEMPFLGCDSYDNEFESGSFTAAIRVRYAERNDIAQIDFDFTPKLTGEEVFGDGLFIEEHLVARTGNAFFGTFESKPFSFEIVEVDGEPTMNLNLPSSLVPESGEYKLPKRITFKTGDCEYFDTLTKPAVRISFFGKVGGVSDPERYQQYKTVSSEILSDLWKRDLLVSVSNSVGDEGGSDSCIQVSPMMSMEEFDQMVEKLESIGSDVDSESVFSVTTDFGC